MLQLTENRGPHRLLGRGVKRSGTMRKNLIIKNTLWVMIITFAGMALSLLVRSILIPKRFGFSGTADEIIVALKIVLVVDTIVREGAKFSLVPLFVTRKNELTHTEYRRFTNGLLFFLLGVGFTIFVLIELLAPWLTAGLLGKPTIDLQRATGLLRLFAPLIIFGCGSTVLGAFLNSVQRFKIVALRNALPAGIAAVVFLLLWDTQNLENYVAAAYTGGFIAYFGWLCIGTHQTGHQYEITGISLDTLRSLKNSVTLPTLGFAVRQITNRLLVEVHLVSKLGEGIIALYEAAFRIFSALQTLIGTSIATTGLPDMAVNTAANDKRKLEQILNRNARAAIIIGFLATLFMFTFHEKISWFIYGRAERDDAVVELIGQLLFWLSAGMLFSCLIPVLNAGLYAQKAYRSIFANMVTMALLNFLLAYGLIETWWILGVALSVSVTALLAVGNLTYLLRRTQVSWF